VRGDAHHVAAATANGISKIDVVVVNRYPFETTNKPGGATPVASGAVSPPAPPPVHACWGSSRLPSNRAARAEPHA